MTSQTLRLVTTESAPADPALTVDGFSAYHGENCILSQLSLDIASGDVTALVGPSGAGKSTFLRALNRMNADVAGYCQQGTLTLCGEDMTTLSDTDLRARIGMVFQQPCVFPTSIAGNVLFGVRHKRLSKVESRELTERVLRDVGLWDEVRTRLDRSADALSLGQQQRLCLARALAVEPEILLMDEPTASIDPVSVRTIEALIRRLKGRYTIIVVTHDIRQARRVADHVVFLCDGEIIESGPCLDMFERPEHELTRTYLTEAICDC